MRQKCLEAAEVGRTRVGGVAYCTRDQNYYFDTVPKFGTVFFPSPWYGGSVKKNANSQYILKFAKFAAILCLYVHLLSLRNERNERRKEGRENILQFVEL